MSFNASRWQVTINKDTKAQLSGSKEWVRLLKAKTGEQYGGDIADPDRSIWSALSTGLKVTDLKTGETFKGWALVTSAQ